MAIGKRARLSDVDVAVYALYILGGWGKRIHTEDIALKCFELAPMRFSWIKYPQYPDIAPARFALEAAKKANNKQLVNGESERKVGTKGIGGWILTENGLKWVESNKVRIEQELGTHSLIGERIQVERRINELLSSKAYKKFQEYGEQANISQPEFAESLVCTVNTNIQILKDRLEQIYLIARKYKRKDIMDYVVFCKRIFCI